MARKKWFTGHPVQAKYMRFVALAMAVPALFLGACLYYVVFELLARQMAFPEAIAANLAPVIRRVNGVLLVGLPLVVAAILRMALVVSHRFAGPVARLEGELDRILGGDADRRIHVRENDDLKGVADRINALLAKKTK